MLVHVDDKLVTLQLAIERDGAIAKQYKNRGDRKVIQREHQSDRESITRIEVIASSRNLVDPKSHALPRMKALLGEGFQVAKVIILCTV